MDLPATALFDYPTPIALAGFIAKQLGDEASTAAMLPKPSSLTAHSIEYAEDVMVLDAMNPRLSSEKPSAVGDGFHVDAVPFSRWDADTSKACQRLGARFARFFSAHVQSRNVCLSFGLS